MARIVLRGSCLAVSNRRSPDATGITAATYRTQDAPSAVVTLVGEVQFEPDPHFKHRSADDSGMNGASIELGP